VRESTSCGSQRDIDLLKSPSDSAQFQQGFKDGKPCYTEQIRTPEVGIHVEQDARYVKSLTEESRLIFYTSNSTGDSGANRRDTGAKQQLRGTAVNEAAAGTRGNDVPNTVRAGYMTAASFHTNSQMGSYGRSRSSGKRANTPAPQRDGQRGKRAPCAKAYA
jgi:hypothetical protein